MSHDLITKKKTLPKMHNILHLIHQDNEEYYIRYNDS